MSVMLVDVFVFFLLRVFQLLEERHGSHPLPSPGTAVPDGLNGEALQPLQQQEADCRLLKSRRPGRLPLGRGRAVPGPAGNKRPCALRQRVRSDALL